VIRIFSPNDRQPLPEPRPNNNNNNNNKWCVIIIDEQEKCLKKTK
jgi:hypothetical protein